MLVDDNAYGRGRHNGDSSSRESSPRQKKRSFSPTSDDGDLVVPPIADDDTPPPPDTERPLLRQPMAFTNWSSTTSVAAGPNSFNTYQATIPTPTASSDTYFLPGQEVALPAPPPSQRRKRKTADHPSKKRKTNDYAGHTSRFRLKPHDHTHEPPYHEKILLETAAAPVAPSPTPVFSGSDSGLTSFSEPVVGSSTRPATAKKKSRQATNSQASKEPGPAITKWRVTEPVSQQPARMTLPPKRPSPPPSRRVSPPLRSSSGGHPLQSVPHESGPGYYRRDYERNITLREPEPTHHSAGGRSQGPENSPTTSRNQNDAPRPHEGGVKDVRRSQKALMLTLLIQDIRSGVTDHQLAEVKIPMKPANDPADGFWADAKSLGQQLQSSASRIDGPAKVYTLRGKYRQFFLRVTADNTDEFISTHLAIKPDRMLDVVVEALLPPGQLPLPPRIPRDLLKSPTPESTSESPTPEPEREAFHELPFERERNAERMRREFERLRQRQESLAEHDRSRSGSPDGGRKSRKGKGKRKRSPEHRSKSSDSIVAAVSTSAAVTVSNDMRFVSPDAEDSSEEALRLITNAVDQIIQEDDGWIGFFQAKAALEPHRALDVLKQYRFVKRMIDQWVGKRVPFKHFQVLIEPSHITRALKIEDPNFAAACLETLGLLDLYGPKGRHYEDPRVIEMMNDTNRPEYNAKPIKRLLHWMRDIDKKWKEENPSQPIPSS